MNSREDGARDPVGSGIGPGPSCRWPPERETSGSGIGHRPAGDDEAGGGDDHGHERGEHGHDHARGASRKALLTVLVLTGLFLIAEVVGGILSHSLALLADAGHMLTDVAALGLSLFALRFAQRPATEEKTYGWLRVEILAALLNGAALIVISLVIFYEAWARLHEPMEIRGGLMLAVAAVGLVVNVVAAVLLQRSAGHSLNVRGAYLHVLGDMLGSVGAIVAAVVIMTTGWTPADPLISVLVGLLILAGSWKLVRESVDILLEAVPRHIDLARVRDALDDIPGVEDVHDLHVWTVTSGVLAMSGHAVVPEPADHQAALDAIHGRMRQRFGIDHVTFQLEREAMYAREHGLVRTEGVPCDSDAEPRRQNEGPDAGPPTRTDDRT